MGLLAVHESRGTWTGPVSLKDPALSRLFGAGYEAAAGVVVTPENAFTFSAVFDAVNQISSDVAKLPLNLLKRRVGGGSDHYVDSKLYRLLKSEPNPEMSSMVFRRTIIAHALTCHGGYAEIERDTVGRPIALWLMTPDRVEVVRETRQQPDGSRVHGPVAYRIDGRDVLPARNVLHIHGLGYDGYCGYSIIQKARQTIGLALAAEKFGAQYFGRGTVFGGWLESADDLDQEQKDEIRASIEAFRNAQDTAFRILVTGAGHKFHQFANKPSESQMDESRIRQVEEVARFFRMPPYRLGVNTPGTVSYASVEAANLDYYTGAMLDWITLIEQEWNRKLISPLEQRQQYIKHNANAFLRADTKARADFYNGMLDRGVFCADDVLELEDMNPQPNGQGRIYLVQGAQVPKDQLVELTAARIEAEQQKAKPPVTPSPPNGDNESGDDDASDERLAEAQRELADARALAQQEREARIAAEASGTATAAEVAERRSAEAAAHEALLAKTLELEALRGQLAGIEASALEVEAARAALVSQMETLSRDLEVAQQSEALAVLAAENRAEEVAAARAAAAEAEQRAAQAQAAAEAETVDRESAMRTAEEARAEALAATERADASERTLQAADEAQAALRAEIDQIRAERAQIEADLRASLEEAQATAQTESARSEALAAEREAASTEASEALMTSRAALSEAESRLGALEQQHAEAKAELERVSQALGAVPDRGQEIESLQAELERVTSERDEAQASRDRASEAADAVVRSEREALRARVTQVLTSHRGLIVDAVGRMTRREVQQARAKQATADKLRRWLNGFSEGHEAICLEAVLPAMRALLAWRGSETDAVEATTSLVREHIALFEAKLRDVLESDPEDFHPRLDRMLSRWESDRAGAVADALLTEELRHVRES